MSEYNDVGVFGGVKFGLSDVSASSRPGTLKTNVGKTFIEKEIPLRNNKDIVLTVQGVITGLSRTSAQTRATAIENDRASLKALDDGNFHSWVDGKHGTINMVIIPGSLEWPDEAARSSGEPYKFSMQLVQWP